MKTITSVILIFILVVFSLSWAEDKSIEEAYSLYYQGRMEEAIKIMEDYVNEHPDPRALYFLGYAYYEIKNMDRAMRYFKEAYLIDPDFTPIPERRAAGAK